MVALLRFYYLKRCHLQEYSIPSPEVQSRTERHKNKKDSPHAIIMTWLKDSNTFVAGMMENKIYSERGGLLFCVCVCSFWGLGVFLKSSPSCTEPGCSIKALSVVFLSVFLFCLAHSPTREKGGKQWRLWPAAVTQYFRTALSTPDINFTPQLAFTHLALPYV